MSLLFDLRAFIKRKTTAFEELKFVRGKDYRYDDADNIAVSYPYSGINDLLTKFQGLGITLESRPPNAAQVEVEIPDHPSYLQPKYIELFGVPVHVLVMKGHITISIRASSGKHLLPREVSAARYLDQKLAMLKIPRRVTPLTMGDLMK